MYNLRLFEFEVIGFLIIPYFLDSGRLSNFGCLTPKRKCFYLFDRRLLLLVVDKKQVCVFIPQNSTATRVKIASLPLVAGREADQDKNISLQRNGLWWYVSAQMGFEALKRLKAFKELHILN